MKRSATRRDWTAARAKVEREGGCRCFTVLTPNDCEGPVEAAHVVGRKVDLSEREGNVVYVTEHRTVPLCRACHRAYDAHELDILPVLSLDEQLQAVADAGSIQSALRRTAPLVYRDLFRGGTEGGANNPSLSQPSPSRGLR